MTENLAYSLSAVYNDENELTDICCTLNNRKFYVLGNASIEREYKIIESFLKNFANQENTPIDISIDISLDTHKNNPIDNPIDKPIDNPIDNPIDKPKNKHIPVFLGIGMGHAIIKLLSVYDSPIVIIDKEKDILEYTQLVKKLNPKQLQQIFWINCSNPHKALKELTIWQLNFDISPPPQLIPILHPFYTRMHRDYYSFLYEELKKAQETTFWNHAIKPRFITDKPRLLLISSKYFLMGEVIEACKFLKIEYEQIILESDKIASNVFVEQLLSKVINLKPDAVITINHSGVDKEGILMHLLNKLQLPLASWFVDNPHLILHRYKDVVSPWVSIFTWDLDNINSLKKDLEFEHIFYLPLATNPQRFKPINPKKHLKKYLSDISFIGNSMYYKVLDRIDFVKPNKILLDELERLATDFDASDEKSLHNFLHAQSPEIINAYKNLESKEQQLAYEAAVTWEATKQYRAKCVEELMPFKPLLVGDNGWNILFKNFQRQYNYQPPLNYYTTLPKFYPCSTINFNCTSKQMKGAVNQRIFDAPAANAFVLTDWREQMDNLFEPNKEIIAYKDISEIQELIKYYLKNDNARNKIVTSARKRILAEHTWAHRLQTLLDHMKNTYGTPNIKTK